MLKATQPKDQLLSLSKYHVFVYRKEGQKLLHGLGGQVDGLVVEDLLEPQPELDKVRLLMFKAHLAIPLAVKPQAHLLIPRARPVPVAGPVAVGSAVLHILNIITRVLRKLNI